MEGVKTMRIMYRCCAGLDVHKETVQCCVRRVEPDGSLQETVRQFGTMTGRSVGDGRGAKSARCDPRGNGIDGRILETDL